MSVAATQPSVRTSAPFVPGRWLSNGHLMLEIGKMNPDRMNDGRNAISIAD